ncbi:MAG: lamin tail domain-containing protein [Bacteroidetes bacterium]|nr:lamin tail domain-containing protein [Bacteroidota bacterium]
MKKLPLLLLLFLLFAFNSYSQVVDNFNDGDFTNNPEWIGDTAYFNVENAQLHSNGLQASSKISLCTSNSMIDSTEWSFLVDLKFAPSSTNFVRIYLVSGDSDLVNTSSAYYIEIGQSNQDSIKFFKKQGSISNLIFTGLTSFATSITELKVRLKICRKADGIWNIYCDKNGGTNYTSEGNSFIENSITTTNYFGFYCQYSTASRYNMYYFDDVNIGNIIPDTIKPHVIDVIVKTMNTLDVIFSEEVDATSSQNPSNYFADNSIGNPIIAIKDLSNNALIHLQFAQNFPVTGINHLTINNIADLNANVIKDVTLPFAYPVAAQPNDVIINEVLFNPKDNGEDYVEIYNLSQKNIDLTKLMIASYDLLNNKLKSMYLIAETNKILYTGEYLVLTKDPAKVKQQYYTEVPANFNQMATMPSFNNDLGTVVVARPDSTIIDRFDYNENMQYPLLVSFKGVALERINSEKATQDPQNWHSAAQSVGFGTPTYKNSQYNTFLYLENPITISPEIFSPDNDGFNDVLNINYQFTDPGYTANVIIYDSKGRLIKTLVKNELLGCKGGFLWNGLDENMQKALIGIYIIYIEVFDVKGNVNSYKKTAVLAGKF